MNSVNTRKQGKSWLAWIAKTLAGGLMLLMAWWLMGVSLDRLAETRQLERLNLSEPGSVTQSGFYRLSGEAVVANETIYTRYSERPALFSVHRHTRREGSGDNSRTRTISSGTRLVDSFILDANGQPFLVKTERDLPAWEIERSYVNRSGRDTYTERSIYPGDTIEILAYYDADTGYIDLSKQHTSGMRAWVHKGDSLMEDVGGKGLLMSALGLSGAIALLTLGGALIFQVVGVHRYWVFTLTLSVAVAGQVIYVGQAKLQEDWSNTRLLVEERLEGHTENVLRLNDAAALYHRLDSLSQGFIDKQFMQAHVGGLFSKEAIDIAQKLEVTPDQVERAVLGHRWLGFLIVGTALLVGFATLLTALKTIRVKRIIEGLPYSEVKGLSYGLSKIQGYVDPLNEQTLALPKDAPSFSASEAVCYHYLVEELRDSGKNKKWQRVDSEIKGQPLLIRETPDAEEGFTLLPQDASIRYSHKETFRQAVNGRQRRYTLRWLNQGDWVTVAGHAGLNPLNSSRLALQDSEDFKLLISPGKEHELLKRKAGQSFILTAISLATLMLAVTAFFTLDGQFSPGNLVYTLMVIPAFLLANVVILHYNDLVLIKNRCIKARENIKVQLQKRADLWPQIEKIVKRYASHEQSLLAAISKMRAESNLQPESVKQLDTKTAKESQLALSVNALSESYPEVKSEPLIAQFQTIMTDTENYLSQLRNSYTHSVEIYNTRIQSFPDMILAKAARFKPLTWNLLLTRGSTD